MNRSGKSRTTAPPRAPSHGHARPASPESAWISILCAAALVLACVHVFWLRFVCDDAYITFRYAANLAHGLGPVWNPGERVEGYTNFLWMVGAVKVIALGGRPEVVMPWASAGCALLTLVAIAWA